MTVIPANPSGLPPTESLFYAGWLKGNYREQNVGTGGLLGIGGVYTGAWEDVSGYCEFRLVTYSDVGSAVGGILLQWSYDGVTVHATEAAATAVGLAVYDSGILAYHYPYIRVQYTNNLVGAQLVSFQLRVIVSPTAVGGGGGGAPIIGIVGQGAPGPVALAWPVELTAPQWSTPSPDPSSIAGALAAGKLDPDRALVTRGGVRTDELAFSDDFYDAGIDRILTGTAAFTLGGTAVVGVGSLFTQEVRVGDYVEYAADHSNPVPVWAQVASITDNTHLTLATAYTGAGGLAALSLVNSWRYLISDALGAINPGNSMWQLQPKLANGSDVQMQRNLTIGGLKGAIPVRHSWYGSISARIANQSAIIGINANRGSMEAEWRFNGVDNTIITCHTRSGAGATGLTETNVALPAGTTATEHLYEILLYLGRTVYLIDGTEVHTDTLHSIYPYWSLRAWASITNTAALGSDTNFNINRVNVEVLDDVKAEVVQPDGSKLHATIDAMPAVSVNVDLQGRVESLPAPNPSAIAGALADLVPLSEPDGALRTRARVLTDEGYLNDDFDPGVILPLTGTSLFTTGLTAVVGVGTLYTHEVQIGDYVQRNTDFNPAAPLNWGQVVAIADDTHLTLERAYAGAGGVTAASSVASWVVYQDGVHGGESNAASIEQLSVDGDAAAFSSLYRRLGAGVFKGTAPVRFGWYGSVNARRAAQSSQVGFIGWNNVTGLPDPAIQVVFHFDGVANTTVKCRTQYAAAASSSWDEPVALPTTTTAANHWYEVVLYPDRAIFYIDYNRVAIHQIHIPREYNALVGWIEIGNNGATAATNLNFDWAGCASYDEVRALVEQPNGAMLHATIDAMPAVSVNVDLQGRVESLPAPNPSAIAGALADLVPLSEPDGALRTRARVLTDEGSFIDPFPVTRLAGAALGGPLTGTCTFVNLSTAVTGAGGSAFTTELRIGDYIKADAHAITCWAQVASIQSDTALTLVAGYTGAGVAGAASSKQNYITVLSGAGTNVDIPAPGGVLRMAAQGAAIGRVILSRALNAGGRKPNAPLEATFTGILFDAAEAAINGYYGFADGYPPIIPPVGDTMVQYAMFRTNGATTTIVNCQTAAFTGGPNTQTTLYTLPGAGVTTASHTYRVLWMPSEVRFYVDGLLAATHVLNLPDPYHPMNLLLALDNLAGAGALNGGAQIEQVTLEDFNYVRATVEQPDGAKLHATIDAMPAIGINVDLQGRVESQPAPNPAAVPSALADLVPLAEPDGALRTRARVLTDEGAFNDDFNGADVWTVLPGTITVVVGSTALVGTAAAIAALKAGDYIEVASDDNPAVPAWIQVRSIDSATTGTLETVYAGLVGPWVAVVGRRSPWIIRYTGAGSGITTAASVVTITPAPGGAGVALLTRKVGFGGRKGCRPVRILGNPVLSADLPNQLGVFGFGNNPDITAATVFANVQAENITTFRVTVYRDGFFTNNDYVLPNGGLTSAQHIVELEWTNQGCNLWVDRVLALQGVGPHIADPYEDLYAVVGVWNTGNPGGASTLTADLVAEESFNLLETRPEQPDASKLNVTVGGAAGAAMIAVGTYLPGWNGEFYGPTAALVAVTPTLLMASPAGGYYAVTVDPIPAAGERVRTLWSRPIPVTGVGYTGFTLTGPAQITVGGTILPNIVVGQFVYFTADGAAFAQLVTVVAPGAGLTVLTLAANYIGAPPPGLGSVCGIATATYATVPPISDGTSPVVLGPLAAQDVIIVYADVAYAGGIVGCARAS